MSDHPSNGRAMTPEEKEAYRQYQIDELQRRRRPLPEESRGTLPARSPVPTPGKCPRCGRPLSERKNRCYSCAPGGRRGPAKPKPLEDRTPVAAVPVPVPVVTAAPDLGRAVVALQGIVDALSTLDDEQARWVLDAAYKLSRNQGES